MSKKAIQDITDLLQKLGVLEAYTKNFRQYHGVNWTCMPNVLNADYFCLNFSSNNISFPWSSTVEGHEFWWNVYIRLIAETQFTNVDMARMFLVFKKVGCINTMESFLMSYSNDYKMMLMHAKDRDRAMLVYMASRLKGQYAQIQKGELTEPYTSFFYFNNGMGETDEYRKIKGRIQRIVSKTRSR